MHPVVGRTRFRFRIGADKGEVFRAGHITGVRAMQIAARIRLLSQRQEHPALRHRGKESLILFLGAIAVDNACRLGDGSDLVYPALHSGRDVHSSGVLSKISVLRINPD